MFFSIIIINFLNIINSLMWCYTSPSALSDDKDCVCFGTKYFIA